MADLFLGLAIVLVISIAAFAAAVKISACTTRTISTILSVAALLTIVFYNISLRDDVLLARLLPFSNLIVLGNLVPPAVCFLAGMAWRLAPGGKLRRGIATSVLIVMGSLSATSPLLGHTPTCENKWSRTGYCLQTTDKTCSAASAATLLQSYGIPATEQEMAELCLTRRGTTWQGLYRGLKQKTAGTKWDVDVFSCSWLNLQEKVDGPAILSVGLENDHAGSLNLEEKGGWAPGVGHSVVIVNFTPNGDAVIADPAVPSGYETWNSAEMRSLCRGYGLRLVRR